MQIEIKKTEVMKKIDALLGISLMKCEGNEKETERVLLDYFHVERIEQLTAAEIGEMNDLFVSFANAIASPKSLDDVELSFNITINGVDHAVVLNDFYDIDLTMNAERLITEFNPDAYARMTFLLAAIYAPMVKRMFDLSWSVERIVYRMAEALKRCPFDDVYSLYHFFLSWKEALKNSSRPSFQQFKRSYRAKLRKLERVRRGLGMHSTPSRTTSGKFSTGLKTLYFLKNTLVIRTKLFYFNLMKRFQR